MPFMGVDIVVFITRRPLGYGEGVMRKRSGIVLFSLMLLVLCSSAFAESIYELRKLTEQEWLDMSTEDRLSALSTARKHEYNQTFIGDFGRNYDLYNKWGYEFYEMEDRYENYAFRGYEAYNILEERRRRWSYNEFGDRISKMRHSATLWTDRIAGDGTSYVIPPGQYINTSLAGVGLPVDGLWVARETTDDFAFSVTGAGAIRTEFTPLTLSIPNVEGVSIDIESANYKIKMITSSYLGSYHNGWTRSSNTSSYLVRSGGVMLRGGRLKRKLGVLTLGASYSNMYGVQGNREDGNKWNGTVNNYTPTPMMVAVRFLDDSPRDGEGGPIIYNARLRINGRMRDDIIPQIIKDDVTRDRTSAITDKLISTYVEPPVPINMGGPEYDFINTRSTIPKYADLMYYNQALRGQNSGEVTSRVSMDLANQYFEILPNTNKPIQANGNESITYIFDFTNVTEKIYRVEAIITVANDYRIQTSHIYTRNAVGGTDPAGKPKEWYDATYWRTQAQAEGNIKDGSNTTTLSLDFGYQVATIVYGVDADFNYMGFKIKGEYATNQNNYMFAEGTSGQGFPSSVLAGQKPRDGYRWTEIDNAYYVTLQKDWKRFGISGEVFKMGKNFNPWLDYYDYQSSSSWLDNIDQRNGIVRIPLVEDNDDGDIYPDTMVMQRVMGYRTWASEDPDGVFPGNDEDNDGVADNNKNNNKIPDYDEPFLMFDSDPDEYVFGNDYNNNNIPDFREDDMKYDLPYDLDREGRHFLLRYTPIDRINLIAGSMRTDGIGLSNRTYNDYFKAIVDYDVFDVGKFYAEYRYETVQDNIQDPYLQVRNVQESDYLVPGMSGQLGQFSRDYYYDELEYRNSRVNRLFLDSRIRAIPSVTVENHIRLESNDQIEGDMYDGTYQPHDVLNTFAMINKIMYMKSFGNFQFSPGVKFRFYKKARSESLQPLDHTLMRIPLFTVKYIFSNTTDVTFGMQGIPGFELSVTDYVQSQNDYSEKNYILQVQNRTTYFGYDIWTAMGFKYDNLTFKEPYRKFEEYKTTSTFINMYLGW